MRGAAAFSSSISLGLEARNHPRAWPAGDCLVCSLRFVCLGSVDLIVLLLPDEEVSREVDDYVRNTGCRQRCT